VIRASKSLHDIHLAQGINELNSYVTCHKSKNLFINRGINAFNDIGKELLKNVINSKDDNLHKSHFVKLGICTLKEFAKAINKEYPIFMLGLSCEIKRSRINTVKDMLQQNLDNLTNIQVLLHQIPIEIRRKTLNPNLEKDETVMRIGKTNLAIKLNIFSL
jgi:hypothetical protein